MQYAIKQFKIEGIVGSGLGICHLNIKVITHTYLWIFNIMFDIYVYIRDIVFNGCGSSELKSKRARESERE